MPTRIGVLGVSDRACMQRQMVCWINQDVHLAASFCVASERDAATLIALHHPAVTLWDLDVDALRAAPASQALLAARQPGHVLAIAREVNDALLQRLLALGLKGCVDYRVAPTMLCAAVHAVHRGELWLPRRILSAACIEMTLLHRGDADADAALSTREREILVWVSHGLMNKEIAQRLGISDKTVKTHLQRIFKKTQLHHRAQLAAQMAARPGHDH